jgi:hypothetical protein
VAVGIGKVYGLRWYPLVVHRPLDSNASFLQRDRGCFDIDFLDRESEVLRWPGSLIFLKHHHAGLPTRPQEQPLAAFVFDANFNT